MTAHGQAKKPPQGEMIAALQVQMGNLDQQVQAIRHQLEGNGKPGLLRQVPELALVQELHGKTLAEIDKSLKASTAAQEATTNVLKDLRTEINAGLDSIKRDVAAHIAPDNKQHKTLAMTWANNPVSLLKQIGIAVVVVFVLYEAGVVRTVAEWVLKLQP